MKLLDYLSFSELSAAYSTLLWGECLVMGKRWGTLMERQVGAPTWGSSSCAKGHHLRERQPSWHTPSTRRSTLRTLKTEPSGWEKEHKHALERSLFLFSDFPTWHVATVHFTSDYVSHIALHRVTCNMMQGDCELCIKMYQQPRAPTCSWCRRWAPCLRGSPVLIQIKHLILLSTEGLLNLYLIIS